LEWIQFFASAAAVSSAACDTGAKLDDIGFALVVAPAPEISCATAAVLAPSATATTIPTLCHRMPMPFLPKLF
jgi:hypothetical protein